MTQPAAAASIYESNSLASVAPTAAAPDTASGAAPNASELNPLDELDAALRELPPALIAPPTRKAKPSRPGQLTLGGAGRPDDVRRELEDLRYEVSQLRSDLDMYLGQYLSQLRQENEDLRRELQLARAGQGARAFAPDLFEMPPSPDGSPPGGAFVPGSAPDTPTAPETPETAPKQDSKAAPNEAVALAVHGGQNYAVVTEWGRSPQDVAQIGGKASSLKGMVCVVPEGSSNDQVMALGRFFRGEFKDYDNINIEVFDNKDAAQKYVETNNASPEHRVLSVSKHRQSGRDTILVLRDGAMTEVGPGR
ncbi:MAG: hypothetical protein HZB26_14200 [Candidatus Hydrogenedentes bacterium]|nr:hypothetical protein [Candidatus Hydrogenedentota bacterium]